jgi:hypothetical protein
MSLPVDNAAVTQPCYRRTYWLYYQCGQWSKCANAIQIIHYITTAL